MSDEQYNLLIDILSVLNRRIEGFELTDEGGNFEEGNECREAITRLQELRLNGSSV